MVSKPPTPVGIRVSAGFCSVELVMYRLLSPQKARRRRTKAGRRACPADASAMIHRQQYHEVVRSAVTWTAFGRWHSSSVMCSIAAAHGLNSLRGDAFDLLGVALCSSAVVDDHDMRRCLLRLMPGLPLSAGRR